MTDVLPLSIPTERIEIRDVGVEWEITMHLEDGDELYLYVETPDALFEQLLEEGIVDPVEVFES